MTAFDLDLDLYLHLDLHLLKNPLRSPPLLALKHMPLAVGAIRKPPNSALPSRSPDALSTYLSTPGRAAPHKGARPSRGQRTWKRFAKRNGLVTVRALFAGAGP